MQLSLPRLRETLAARPAVEIHAPQQRRACVLIPLIRSGERWSLLFTRRAENLAAHSGQISFPGGAVEPGEDLEQAARREAHEEIGLPSERVELIGRLDDLITNSGFLVAPFVGLVHERIDFVMQESEVVEIFEVPLEALLDPAQPEVRYVSFRNRRYPAYYYLHRHYEIWGLTGRILKSLLDQVWLCVE